jgi:hypothetical protein
MRSVEKAKAVLKSWPNRLLLVWVLVTAVLVNHDLFMRPVQPLHFSRGYLWIPLFLLGLPSIIGMFARIGSLRPRPVAALATLLIIAVFVSDNAAWLGIRSGQALGIGAGRFGLLGEPGSTVTALGRSTLGFGLSADQLQVLRAMNDSANRGFVVVSSDSILAYLATAYSPLRSWRSHLYNTPETLERQAELRAFFDSGRIDPAWNALPTLFVFRQDDPWAQRILALGPATATVVMQNASYVIVRRPPPHRPSSVLVHVRDIS